jgi:hypothetical protein
MERCLRQGEIKKRGTLNRNGIRGYDGSVADMQSPLANKILNANPHAYEALVAEGPTPKMARELLEGVTPDQLLAAPVKSAAYADVMLAGLWLWHDGLEESHRISQSISDVTGSFWHAIMHRREGDFSNSKYWYARASGHPVLATLAGSVGPLVNRAPADKSLLRIVANGWNPNAFVDFVESVSADEADVRYPIAVQLQQVEWRVLWEHCAREA